MSASWSYEQPARTADDRMAQVSHPVLPRGSLCRTHCGVHGSAHRSRGLIVLVGTRPKQDRFAKPALSPSPATRALRRDQRQAGNPDREHRAEPEALPG
jgi:hypothetical protein